MTLKYRCIASADVDGEPWVTIVVTQEIAAWINSSTLKFYRHVGEPYHNFARYDMPEKHYTFLRLRCQPT